MVDQVRKIPSLFSILRLTENILFGQMLTCRVWPMTIWVSGYSDQFSASLLINLKEVKVVNLSLLSAFDGTSIHYTAFFQPYDNCSGHEFASPVEIIGGDSRCSRKCEHLLRVKNFLFVLVMLLGSVMF